VHWRERERVEGRAYRRWRERKKRERAGERKMRVFVDLIDCFSSHLSWCDNPNGLFLVGGHKGTPYKN
jgi:hypothetical protein